MVQCGPALPDVLYYTAPTYKGPPVHLAPPGSAYKLERWRKDGLEPRPVTLRLHHESARVNGELVPAKQGAIISKEAETGWALEYKPVGGIRFVVGDISTIKLKRGTWLSDTFALLWLQGEAGRPNAAIFRAEAAHLWWQKLRKRKSAEFWAGFNPVGELELLEQRQRWRARDIRDAIVDIGDGKTPVELQGISRKGVEAGA